jgi:hypothetical protein
MATLLMVVGGASLLLLRGPGDGGALSDDVAVERHTTVTQGTVVEDSLFDGSGLCSASVTRDTLYLGGPAWDGNMAVDDAMLPLPTAVSTTELVHTSSAVGSSVTDAKARSSPQTRPT